MNAPDFDIWYHFNLLPENDGQQFHITPGDPGGATAWGWTYNVWKACAPMLGQGDLSLDAFKRQTPDTLKPLTVVQFWNSIRADLMPRGINVFWADFHFNSGRATSVLQAAIGVFPDGVVGTEETIPAILKFTDRHALLDRLLAARIAYYDREGFKTRWPGVYRRARSCYTLAAGLLDAEQVRV